MNHAHHHAGHAPHPGQAHHRPPAAAAPHAAHGAHGGGSIDRLTTAATLHCLLGCAIGEFIGLALGVHLGLGPWVTMALATALGFVSGFAVSLVPLVRSGLSLASAWRAIWLGETISIAAMEAAMNLADYHVGGMAVGSVADPMFWAGYGAALAAGFLVAWPVNRLMLGREIKRSCH
jgi:hypothetical protein